MSEEDERIPEGYMPLAPFANTWNQAVTNERQRLKKLIGDMIAKGDKPSEILEWLLKVLDE